MRIVRLVDQRRRRRPFRELACPRGPDAGRQGLGAAPVLGAVVGDPRRRRRRLLRAAHPDLARAAGCGPGSPSSGRGLDDEPMHDWLGSAPAPAGLLAARLALRERGIASRPCSASRGTASGRPGGRGATTACTCTPCARCPGLPGFRFRRSYGRWVARDDFVAYLDAYAGSLRHRALGPASASPDRSDGRRLASRDVAGLRPRGEARSSSRPATATSPPAIRVARPRGRTGASSSTRSSTGTPSPYRGRDVLVVGTGNSAPKPPPTSSREAPRACACLSGRHRTSSGATASASRRRRSGSCSASCRSGR